jgi:hypothetical protein
MGVLKRRQENEPITFKVPVGLKREIDYLRGRAEAAGFDLAETITAAMWRLCKQIRVELEPVPPSNGKQGGRASEPTVEKAQ